MITSFYSEQELSELGFRSFGKNVQVSRKCSIYGAENITLGSNVRIDDFSILSGRITIGSYVRVGPLCCLCGGQSGIEVNDYSGISSRCAIYAVSDDYSGNAFANPTIPLKFRNVTDAKVILGKYTSLGTGSTVLPGVTIEEGVSVGSMSLVRKSLEPWAIYIGIPCRKLKERSRKIIEMEQELIKETGC